MKSFFLLILIVSIGSSCGESSPHGQVIRVATASNFLNVLNQISAEFTKETGISVAASSASTGVIFAQVQNGAPFDVFLSADAERPLALMGQGLAQSRSAFTYAKGRLALVCSSGATLPADVETLLSQAPFSLTIANEELAPFGRAALQALGQSRQELADRGIRVVRGTNVSQAWHFMVSGAVDYAIVPLSLAQSSDFAYKELPRSSYDTIEQVAVLLQSSKAKEESVRFLEFLKGATARKIIEEAGYDAGED